MEADDRAMMKVGERHVCMAVSMAMKGMTTAVNNVDNGGGSMNVDNGGGSMNNNNRSVTMSMSMSMS